MGKYGKKNHVKTNPLDYNIMLLGESGIGKSTLIKEVCEKLVGEDGYLFAEFGNEAGANCIENINYVNIKLWNEEHLSLSSEQMDLERKRMELNNEAFLEEVIDDIVENKNTDYPDLKVFVWDTLDQIIPMAQNESIRLWNRECSRTGHPEKRTTSINMAWGGFGKADLKAMDIMDEVIEKLEKVGVKTIIIGHVKMKEIVDAVTGETYQVLTSDQQQNYFSHFKKNLHFLGLAYLDRQIAREKYGKKNIVTGKDNIVGKVKDETRRIKFRDDNHAIDSKSRFSNIAPDIELSADAFIKAIKDAIEFEINKSGRNVKEVEKEEEESNKIKNDIIEDTQNLNKSNKELSSLKAEIISFFVSNKNNQDVVKPVLLKIRELGYSNPNEITNIEDAKIIYDMIVIK